MITGNPQSHISISNKTRSTMVCRKGRIANTFLTRLFGLLGSRKLDPDAGLLIQPCSGVHTFGMKFAIDIVALDREYRVVGVWSDIGPWRIRGLSRRTRRVLELPSGQIERAMISVGDELALTLRGESGVTARTPAGRGARK